ncbi:hypothetical protein BC332_25066 [Capsicum chinense]|nr:hypothetical protein BC332_25066 [Capsicum chinense]
MLLGILRCFSLVNDNTYLKSTEQLSEQVYRSLKERRYLIAMDDVWDTNAWYVVKRSFADDKNGSRVILTSRLANIGIYASSGSPHYMRCLSVEECLRLFNLKVFGRETCPFELDKATKQIVDKCQGLPLTIVMVAGFCSKISKTENCWEDVAHKPCFLYMGAFPKDYEISVSRLIKLWIAAEYVRCKPEKDFEEVAEGYLSDLIGRSLIMVKKKTSSGKVKTCEVHDLLHDLILREFGVAPLAHIEHVYDISSLPRASSFLCFERDGTPGSCSQVDSFITFTNFKWLTVLDMCFQPFDHLPSEIWELSQLRYLALSNFSVLPPSVCNLRHRQTLFRYSNQASICLPAEIWVIKQLRHLYFRKCCYFPNVQSEQEDYLLKLSDYNLVLTKLQTLPCYPGKFSRSNLALTNRQTFVIIWARSEWETTDECFQQLNSYCWMGLILPTESLVLKNCYCLYEILDDVAKIPTLQFIELYHCSSSADDSAYRIQEEQLSIGNDDLVLNLKACVCLIFSALPQQSTKLMQSYYSKCFVMLSLSFIPFLDCFGLFVLRPRICLPSPCGTTLNMGNHSFGENLDSSLVSQKVLLPVDMLNARGVQQLACHDPTFQARADQFLNLYQGNMSMRVYSLRFNSLSRYAPNVVATMDDRVHQYVDRLDPYLVRDCTIAALNKDMDIARIQAFAQKMEDQRQRRRTQESERGYSKRARSTGQFMAS